MGDELFDKLGGGIIGGNAFMKRVFKGQVGRNEQNVATHTMSLCSDFLSFRARRYLKTSASARRRKKKMRGKGFRSC